MDYRFIADRLRLNMGEGYYSYADHVVAPMMLSDASDSRRYSGGGWVCADGDHDFFIYAGLGEEPWALRSEKIKGASE